MRYLLYQVNIDTAALKIFVRFLLKQPSPHLKKTYCTFGFAEFYRNTRTGGILLYFEFLQSSSWNSLWIFSWIKVYGWCTWIFCEVSSETNTLKNMGVLIFLRHFRFLRSLLKQPTSHLQKYCHLLRFGILQGFCRNQSVAFFDCFVLLKLSSNAALFSALAEHFGFCGISAEV